MDLTDLSIGHCCKCERCGAEDSYGYGQIYTLHNASDRSQRYPICNKCLHEWQAGGYYNIWWSFYRADSFELANKFVLDFLGKLGK